MAEKTIAVDLDEAAHALKLLSEYLMGGPSLVCRTGVVGTDEGVAASFYQRLATLESQLVRGTRDIQASLKGQFDAISDTIKALAETDASLAAGAKELIAQIDAMKAATTANTRAPSNSAKL